MIVIIFLFILLLFLKKPSIESFFNMKKQNLVFIQYFKNKNSFICDRKKIWGNWVQSSFLMEILGNLNLNKISCNLNNLPSHSDVLIIGLEQSKNLKSTIKKLNPKVVFFLSDEYGKSPHINHILKNVPLVFREYRWNKYPTYPNIKYLPLGYHCWDDNIIRPKNQLSIKDKKYIWCFMGNDKGKRQKILNYLRKNLQPYFNEKTNARENTEVYNNSIFAICLNGNIRIECNRECTSAMSGSIPIMLCTKEKFEEAYHCYDKNPPYLRADNEIDCVNIIKNLLNQPKKLESLQKEQNIWWNNLINGINLQVKNILKKN